MHMVAREFGPFSIATGGGLGSFGDDMVVDGHWDDDNQFQSYFKPGTSAAGIPGAAAIRPR